MSQMGCEWWVYVSDGGTLSRPWGSGTGNASRCPEGWVTADGGTPATARFGKNGKKGGRGGKPSARGHGRISAALHVGAAVREGRIPLSRLPCTGEAVSAE